MSKFLNPCLARKEKKMTLSPNKSLQNKNGGPMNTTTWGALIALSLVLTGLGLARLASHADGNQQPFQAAANSVQGQVPASPLSGRGTDSYKAGADGRTLNSAATPENRNPHFTASVDRAVAPLPPAIGLGEPSAPSASLKDRTAVQQSPVSGASSTGALSLQAQIAAKIAPDLQGIDPQKPVDVIVQFNKSAAPSDLTADGATLKSSLPLIHAQLVTVRGVSLNNLASESGVAYISPNRKVRGAIDPVVTAVN